ncbi:hypothetical protein Ahy_B06g079884 isoform C [Arachis hypogaea]|uniref:PARP-type domain-containing protein n=1 Tax=Arachis hypogaea TaxID=3818 RepID=A0A444YGK2_ARAHY|nr:hypothetical protein Ahy_B06g079884 isoform C [Arachis hypogaea]
MATPQKEQKPWKAEYAKSGRSSCRTCKAPIDKEQFRLGKMVQSTKFDGIMAMWNHADCILRKSNQINYLETLRWEDQQKVRRYVEAGASTTTKSKSVKDTECGIEVSQNARATCKHCSKKITKGEVGF